MDNKKSILDLVYHYKKNKEHKKGIELLEEIIKQDNNPDYKIFLTEFYYNIRNYNKAENYIQEVLKSKPSNFRALLINAKLLMKQEKYRQALDILLNLYNRKNNDTDTILHLGICYLKMDQVDNAILYLNKTISTAIQSAYTYYYLATAYYKKGDTENAVKLMEKASKISNSSFYYSILIKYKIGDLPVKNRIKELRRILTIENKKDIANLHVQLAENLLKDKEYDNAVEEFHTAIRINSTKQFYKERYVYACGKAGKHEMVYNLIPDLIKKKPFSAWMQVYFTKACIKLNKVEEGLEFYYNLIKKTEDKRTGKQIKVLKAELELKGNKK